MSRINLPWQRGINWFRYVTEGEGEKGDERFAFDKYLLSRLDLLFFSKRCKFDEREQEEKRKEKEREGIKRKLKEGEKGRDKRRLNFLKTVYKLSRGFATGLEKTDTI